MTVAILAACSQGDLPFGTESLLLKLKHSGYLKKGWKAGSSCLLLLKVNRETGLPQIAELRMEGLNPVSPEACIFPEAEC